MRIQWLLAAAAGLIVANIYYVQPLTGLICQALGIPLERAGLLVTFTQLGYGAGLLLLVPLADLLENRALVLMLVALEMACMALAGMAHSAVVFFGMSFLIGLTAVAVQILVPYVTHVTPEAEHGRAVGSVVSGLMLGIMLSRPLASFCAQAFSWRTVFWISALAMAVLLVVLRLALPQRRPRSTVSYRGLLASLAGIALHSNALRRRALYQACMFGAFSAYWTAVPLWLTSAHFGFSQRGVAWVALAGVAGAVGPPIAGRAADRGFVSMGTMLGMLLAIASFAISLLSMSRSWGVGPVVVCAMLLDFAVSCNLVFGQRTIFALGAEQRGRMNGVFMATFFVGGAVSSALSAWCFARWGWPGVAAIGMLLPLLALGYFLTESRQPQTARR
jgi:predicted MFS family arabinose efflux permease